MNGNGRKRSIQGIYYRLANIPIIATTANAFEEDRQVAMKECGICAEENSRAVKTGTGI